MSNPYAPGPGSLEPGEMTRVVTLSVQPYGQADPNAYVQGG